MNYKGNYVDTRGGEAKFIESDLLAIAKLFSFVICFFERNIMKRLIIIILV